MAGLIFNTAEETILTDELGLIFKEHCYASNILHLR